MTGPRLFNWLTSKDEDGEQDDRVQTNKPEEIPKKSKPARLSIDTSDSTLSRISSTVSEPWHYDATPDNPLAIAGDNLPESHTWHATASPASPVTFPAPVPLRDDLEDAPWFAIATEEQPRALSPSSPLEIVNEDAWYAEATIRSPVRVSSPLPVSSSHSNAGDEESEFFATVASAKKPFRLRKRRKSEAGTESSRSLTPDSAYSATTSNAGSELGESAADDDDAKTTLATKSEPVKQKKHRLSFASSDITGSLRSAFRRALSPDPPPLPPRSPTPNAAPHTSMFIVPPTLPSRPYSTPPISHQYDDHVEFYSPTRSTPPSPACPTRTEQIMQTAADQIDETSVILSRLLRSAKRVVNSKAPSPIPGVVVRATFKRKELQAELVEPTGQLLEFETVWPVVDGRVRNIPAVEQEQLAEETNHIGEKFRLMSIWPHEEGVLSDLDSPQGSCATQAQVSEPLETQLVLPVIGGSREDLEVPRSMGADLLDHSQQIDCQPIVPIIRASCKELTDAYVAHDASPFEHADGIALHPLIPMTTGQIESVRNDVDSANVEHMEVAKELDVYVVSPVAVGFQVGTPETGLARDALFEQAAKERKINLILPVDIGSQVRSSMHSEFLLTPEVDADDQQIFLARGLPSSMPSISTTDNIQKDPLANADLVPNRDADVNVPQSLSHTIVHSNQAELLEVGRDVPSRPIQPTVILPVTGGKVDNEDIVFAEAPLETIGQDSHVLEVHPVLPTVHTQDTVEVHSREEETDVPVFAAPNLVLDRIFPIADGQVHYRDDMQLEGDARDAKIVLTLSPVPLNVVLPNVSPRPLQNNKSGTTEDDSTMRSLGGESDVKSQEVSQSVDKPREVEAESLPLPPTMKTTIHLPFVEAVDAQVDLEEHQRSVVERNGNAIELNVIVPSSYAEEIMVPSDPGMEAVRHLVENRTQSLEWIAPTCSGEIAQLLDEAEKVVECLKEGMPVIIDILKLGNPDTGTLGVAHEIRDLPRMVIDAEQLEQVTDFPQIDRDIDVFKATTSGRRAGVQKASLEALGPLATLIAKEDQEAAEQSAKPAIAANSPPLSQAQTALTTVASMRVRSNSDNTDDDLPYSSAAARSSGPKKSAKRPPLPHTQLTSSTSANRRVRSNSDNTDDDLPYQEVSERSPRATKATKKPPIPHAQSTSSAATVIRDRSNSDNTDDDIPYLTDASSHVVSAGPATPMWDSDMDSNADFFEQKYSDNYDNPPLKSFIERPALFRPRHTPSTESLGRRIMESLSGLGVVRVLERSDSETADYADDVIGASPSLEHGLGLGMPQVKSTRSRKHSTLSVEVPIADLLDQYDDDDECVDGHETHNQENEKENTDTNGDRTDDSQSTVTFKLDRNVISEDPKMTLIDHQALVPHNTTVLAEQRFTASDDETITEPSDKGVFVRDPLMAAITDATISSVTKPDAILAVAVFTATEDESFKDPVDFVQILENYGSDPAQSSGLALGKATDNHSIESNNKIPERRNGNDHLHSTILGSVLDAADEAHGQKHRARLSADSIGSNVAIVDGGRDRHEDESSAGALAVNRDAQKILSRELETTREPIIVQISPPTSDLALDRDVPRKDRTKFLSFSLGSNVDSGISDVSGPSVHAVHLRGGLNEHPMVEAQKDAMQPTAQSHQFTSPPLAPPKSLMEHMRDVIVAQAHIPLPADTQCGNASATKLSDIPLGRIFSVRKAYMTAPAAEAFDDSAVEASAEEKWDNRSGQAGSFKLNLGSTARKRSFSSELQHKTGNASRRWSHYDIENASPPPSGLETVRENGSEPSLGGENDDQMSWMAAIGATFAVASYGFSFSLLNIAGPIMTHSPAFQSNTGHGAAELAQASYLVACVASAAIWLWFAGVWGPARPLVFCLFLFAVCMALCSFGGDWNRIISFEAIAGVGGGGILPLTFLLVKDSMKLRHAVRVYVVLALTLISSLSFAPLIGHRLLLNTFTNRKWIFLLPALLCVPAIILFVLLAKRLSTPTTRQLTTKFSTAMLLAFAVAVALSAVVWGGQYPYKQDSENVQVAVGMEMTPGNVHLNPIRVLHGPGWTLENGVWETDPTYTKTVSTQPPSSTVSEPTQTAPSSSGTPFPGATVSSSIPASTAISSPLTATPSAPPTKSTPNPSSPLSSTTPSPPPRPPPGMAGADRPPNDLFLSKLQMLDQCRLPAWDDVEESEPENVLSKAGWIGGMIGFGTMAVVLFGLLGRQLYQSGVLTDRNGKQTLVAGLSLVFSMTALASILRYPPLQLALQACTPTPFLLYPLLGGMLPFLLLFLLPYSKHSHTRAASPGAIMVLVGAILAAVDAGAVTDGFGVGFMVFGVLVTFVGSIVRSVEGGGFGWSAWMGVGVVAGTAFGTLLASTLFRAHMLDHTSASTSATLLLSHTPASSDPATVETINDAMRRVYRGVALPFSARMGQSGV
ncbi:hypothetical protein SpCBS45565_g04513 [Spizellomyces sp. 'palustris']|nr:hypothetical protein SpCBS45565_g04513 [Spizellomyces sp. 'palustris']